MFKRATWLGVGFSLGVGTTVVAARKARQQLDRYKPPAVVDRVATSITDKASTLRTQVTAALDDGKQAADKRPRRRNCRRRPARETDGDPPSCARRRRPGSQSHADEGGVRGSPD